MHGLAIDEWVKINQTKVHTYILKESYILTENFRLIDYLESIIRMWNIITDAEKLFGKSEKTLPHCIINLVTFGSLPWNFRPNGLGQGWLSAVFNTMIIAGFLVLSPVIGQSKLGINE